MLPLLTPIWLDVLQCPMCDGRGRIGRGRVTKRDVCPICSGRRMISPATFEHFADVSQHSFWMLEVIRDGTCAEAAAMTRVTARLARALLDHCQGE